MCACAFYQYMSNASTHVNVYSYEMHKMKEKEGKGKENVVLKFSCANKNAFYCCYYTVYTAVAMVPQHIVLHCELTILLVVYQP